MDLIHLLDKNTIDKIAAGEVVDRPASIVKELCENSIDAGADSISIEITDGGIAMIRITDNGSGIDSNQVKKAFLRHSTSKIQDADDLSFIKTLGFRGEALSSIAAVSRLELYTKTPNEMTGTIYKLNGGEETVFEEAGLPDGTTIIIRDIFFNTPARLKFLKTAKTEAGYISDIIERIALSHPDISFKFRSNNSLKLSTSGNGSLKDTIYAVYGRDIAANLLEINESIDTVTVKGYIGKPSVSRGNRNFENYFINGRYIKDKVIESAIEEAYRGRLMKGTFPFTAFDIHIEPELIDVNVHPSKMQIRFYDNEHVFNIVSGIISSRLAEKENIPEVSAEKDQKPSSPVLPGKEDVPEPFETQRAKEFLKQYTVPEKPKTEFLKEDIRYGSKPHYDFTEFKQKPKEINTDKASQQSVFTEEFISPASRKDHRLVGEVFDTYWIIEFNDQIYIIDQHAAHEKVLYERFMNNVKNQTHYSQNIVPALIISPDHTQEAALLKYKEQFDSLGFVIEPFSDNDYYLSAVPMDLYGIGDKEKFMLILDELSGLKGDFSPEILLDRVATASCKAAVKGGDRLSFAEADALIDELLDLENPYNCPHGRPTIITMTRSELERKFKRLI